MPVIHAINAATVLDQTITSSMVGGVLNEVVAVIPTIIPVAISFIAIRKGISFVLGIIFCIFLYYLFFLEQGERGSPFPLIF